MAIVCMRYLIIIVYRKWFCVLFARLFNQVLTALLQCLHPSVTDEARGGAVKVRDFRKRAKEGEGLFFFSSLFRYN